MMTSFDSRSREGEGAAAERSRGQIGPFTVGIVISGMILVGLLVGWGPAESAYKSWRARRLAADVRRAVEAQDWAGAYRLLGEARGRSPDDVEVISASVEFLKATKSDPAGLVQQLRMLEKHRPLDEEEVLLLGRTLITIGKADEARKVHERLPLSVSSQSAGLQLLAEILAAEGHAREARIVDNRATAAGAASNDPEAVLQMSMKETASAFPEVRQKARSHLWEAAEHSDSMALEAIGKLAADKALIAADAERLLALVEKHPLAKLDSRLQVVSALARVQPDRAAGIYQKEVERFQRGGQGRLEDIAFWLMKERQHELIFGMVPVKLALKSRELYPILMQTMGQAGRWDELRDLLRMPNPPVPQSLADLALAEVQARLEPDMRESRRLLEGTVKAAVTEGNVPTLHKAAELATKLNLPDIAASAYLEAGLKSATGATVDEAVRCLQKGGEAALMAKETTLLLRVSRKLQELSPGSAAYADRLAYLRLILGVEMETVSVSQTEEPSLSAMLTIAIERVPASLLKALAAYRLGDMEAVKEHLAKLPDASSLPAGQRAVVAGLLALAGRPDRAFQIAEKVPETLLLREELAFLNRAR